MKYCWKKISICLIWIILFGSISLFGQDYELTWTLSRWRVNLPVSIVTLPENLLHRLLITNSEATRLKPLLSEKDTGIFKLWNDICGEIKIIDAEKDKDCLEYSDYALGSKYSFELKSYSDVYSNIFLSKNTLSVQSNSQQTSQILMDLGKREIKEINKKTKEVVELSKIKMVDRYGVFQMNKILDSDAIKSKQISLSYPAKLEHIFLLRSVFWDNRGKFIWQRDTVYVLKIMALENNVATIIWKKVSSK